MAILAWIVRIVIHFYCEKICSAYNKTLQNCKINVILDYRKSRKNQL